MTDDLDLAEVLPQVHIGLLDTTRENVEMLYDAMGRKHQFTRLLEDPNADLLIMSIEWAWYWNAKGRPDPLRKYLSKRTAARDKAGLLTRIATPLTPAQVEKAKAAIKDHIENCDDARWVTASARTKALFGKNLARAQQRVDLLVAGGYAEAGAGD